MKRFDWSDSDCREDALARPRGRADPAMLADVRQILDAVRDGGWDALVRIASRIDGAAPERLDVASFAASARSALPSAAQAAMRLAADHIETFHRATLPQPVEVITTPGLSVSKLWRPLDRAGLYIPGGRAPLFSTLLMLAIPARVAGVGAMVVVTPPRPDGGLDPAVALAAQLCGIESIWTVGGAQAIAALAFGAGGIPAVDRICGPGNAWVSTAKAMVAARPGGPGIDLPAGPSELMVVAGATGDPTTIAADLLSQAEHDRDAQAILVSPDAALIDAVDRAATAQSASLSDDLAPLRAVHCASLDEAIAIANLYAPEHLALACAEAATRVDAVRHAGALFVGRCAAESFGDYLAGSSHVLPTDGAARFAGGVSTLTFMKAMTVQRATPRTAAALAAPAAALARLEGLEAHARAAEARAAG
jgi:histidinol dehydrogenase